MRERLPPSSEPPWFCTHSPPGMPKTRAYQPPRAPTPAFLVPNTLFVSVRHDDAGEGGKGRASSPAATRWSPPPPHPSPCLFGRRNGAPSRGSPSLAPVFTECVAGGTR